MEIKKEPHTSAFLGTNKDISVGEIRFQTNLTEDGELKMKDYILIKLRSGEEIIANIISANRNGMKVLRPMQIKQVPFVDYVNNSLRAAVVMENWIGRTTNDEVTIPNNWIGLKLTPSPETIVAYEKSMTMEDMPRPSNKVESVKDELSDADSHNIDELSKLEEEMGKMISEMSVSSGMTMPTPKGMSDFYSSMNSMGKPSSEGKDMVVVNFMFPWKMFKNMMEDGILEDFLSMGMGYDNGDSGDEDLDEDMEEDTDPSPREKKRSPDTSNPPSNKELWGNNFDDWSPDPTDYI